MAEETIFGTALQGIGFDGSSLANAGGTLSIAAIVILCLGVFIFLFLILNNLKKFKHPILIKNRTSGVPVVIRDKARIYYDADGTESYWKLLKLKVNIPVPPDWAREQTDKGQFMVRGEIDPSKGIMFIKLKHGQEFTDKDIIYDKISEQKVDDSGEKFTQNMKIFYTQQLLKAIQEKAGTTKWDVLNKAIMPVFFILVLLIGLIFIPSVLEAYQGVLEEETKVMHELADLTSRIDGMRECKSTVSQQQIDPRPD